MDGTKFKRFRSQSPFYSSYPVSFFNSSHDWLGLSAKIMFKGNHSYQLLTYSSQERIQFNSVTQSCPTLCDPMKCSMPGLSVHHQLPELTQTHVHRVSDAIQPSHPLWSPSLPAFNHSQHQDLFKWISSSHQMAKLLEFQLQHLSFQWLFRTDLL